MHQQPHHRKTRGTTGIQRGHLKEHMGQYTFNERHTEQGTGRRNKSDIVITISYTNTKVIKLKLFKVHA